MISGASGRVWRCARVTEDIAPSLGALQEHERLAQRTRLIDAHQIELQKTSSWRSRSEGYNALKWSRDGACAGAVDPYSVRRAIWVSQIYTQSKRTAKGR